MAEDSGKYGTEAAAYTGPPVEEKMTASRYFATRFRTLKPPMHKAPNPFKLLGMLNRQQWLFFLIGFLGWTWDAFDFFTVSLVRGHASYPLPPSVISWNTC
jgi:SHS family lactate transporter-like MFS transporter